MNTDQIPIVNDYTPQQSQSHTIPTNDDDVRRALRQMGEPITYFGEDRADRRQRLIKLVQEAPKEITYFGQEDEEMAKDDVSDDQDDDEDFYTPGTQQLYDSRLDILKYSLMRASRRVDRLRGEANKNQDMVSILNHRREINNSLAKCELYGTQLIPGNTRAISRVRFCKPMANGTTYIAAGSWNGSVYILNLKDLTTVKSLVGHHTEKVTLEWLENSLVSGGNEGTLNVWNLENTKPIHSIKNAHDQRISGVLVHPSAKYVATTSFDQIWKLWDIQTHTELVQQEGHSKEVFAGAFHPDGSLFTSGGLDGIIKVWDLRSGRAIATFDKHISGIYALDWSPNGHHLASASGDSAVKIWDFRRNNELFSIPAHTKLVSDVKFSGDGTSLVTSSYDGLVNIWSADNWVRVKSLKGHNDKVMSCDVTQGAAGLEVVSSGWDRSVKLWKV
ncbi:WD40 repeat-like protein [Suhomyces tanzawaensis NRRL Y-17324]|uniref:WD40 repeat-like protein n=1 Tax=Suhomyces tanzawaensis NRRL Y-17324 TaxID=984487 RepID=A0A1E4SNV7_9ASCO|nr:WD40 repeat-like protein [Suhomyces tanzawaensis NRRL Y-17324]ODV81072.1 WD40 repeat-like protein [Suhomyces tanzawaensis NRRL Y-17324]